MQRIDTNLLNGVTAQAKESPRLRMNHNFHGSLEAVSYTHLTLPTNSRV